MSRKICTLPGGFGDLPLERAAEERKKDFNEVIQSYNERDTYQAAQRCLAAHMCTYCEVCQLLCPDLCITRDSETGNIMIDLDHCKGCGLCAHFCPKGAIVMELEVKK